ncbi:MAG: SgcJ/EcaC family oxidoreductase [Scytonema sp. RU_4_4]|nr:SgcJ/EcaC family oxidoreductase [Scytonema sp. RU_4_4]NJR75331.1 SgcJ/EcaC family oxidoreductase [Scytonema sp. CRU_2_7]
METQLSTSNTADETAIGALKQQMIEGWSQGSGDAFAAPFAEDANFVAFDGTRFEGKQEIASSHQQLFDKYVKGTRLVGEVESVRFLAPDLAVVRAVGGTQMPGQSDTSPGRDSMQMFVAIKRGDQWRIVEFTNSRIVTLEQQLFMDDFDSLPAEAQRQVTDLVTSLKQRDQS